MSQCFGEMGEAVMRLFALLLVISLAGCAQKTVFIGDSITYRWAQLEQTGAINAGISGQTSQQIAARFKHDAIDTGAKTVVILAGTNDKTADITYIAQMAIAGRAAGMRVILCEIPPLPIHGGVYMPRVQAFNASLIKFASEKSFPLVDYFDALNQPPLFVDGIHPNDAGYVLMWAQLQSVIKVRS